MNKYLFDAKKWWYQPSNHALSDFNWINNRKLYIKITKGRKLIQSIAFFPESLKYYQFTIHSALCHTIKRKTTVDSFLNRNEISFWQLLKTKGSINFLSQNFQEELCREMSFGSNTEINTNAYLEFSRAKRCINLSLDDYFLNSFKEKSIEQIVYE